jgi:DNA-binding transcriptional LysR family regulator
MELRQLAHFVAVAEERHFTRAADRVQMVQSSLSSSIAALERELGGPLLTRNSRRVELTEAGRALLPAARRALAAADEGRARVDAVRGLLRGQLTVGVIQSFSAIDLPALFARYHRAYPAITLQLRHDSVPRLVRATGNGEVDLAFVDHPFDQTRVRHRSFGQEKLILAVPATDPLARRSSIRLQDLTDRGFVEYRRDSALRTRIDAACSEAGLNRKLTAEVDTIADLVDLVAAGVGVALLPPNTVNRGAGVRALATRPAVTRVLAVVTAADRPPAPAAQALLDLLADATVDGP